MSKLTETVCVKVSKETKSFLDQLDNSSEFVRRLIIRSQNTKQKLSEFTYLENSGGQDLIAFDEEKLNNLVDSLGKEIFMEVFQHARDITKK